MSALPQVNTQITGAMPFGDTSGISGLMASASPIGQAAASGYQQAYGNALAQNQANYQNILSGYQQTAANQQTQQQAVAGGYSQLANQIGQGYGQLGNQLGSGYGNLGQQLGQGYGALGQGLGGGYNALNAGVQAQLGGSLGTLQQGGQALNQGYGQLAQGVLGQIQGIGASQAQAIQDAYAQQQGQTTQGLLNSGLGNTTVVGNMQRGVTLDAQKAQVALANQMAQLTAGYTSQLGLAGLNQQNQNMLAQSGQQNLMAQYGANLGQQGLQAQQQVGMTGLGAQQQTGLTGLAANQSLGQNYLGAQQAIGGAGLGYQGAAAAANTQQANNQLGWMNSIQSQYPDANAYSGLLQQYGQNQQFQQAQQQQADQFRQLMAAAQQARAQNAGGRVGGVLGTESGAGLPGQGQLQGGGTYGAPAPNWSIPQSQLAYQQLLAQQGQNPQAAVQNGITTGFSPVSAQTAQGVLGSQLGGAGVAGGVNAAGNMLYGGIGDLASQYAAGQAVSAVGQIMNNSLGWLPGYNAGGGQSDFSTDAYGNPIDWSSMGY